MHTFKNNSKIWIGHFFAQRPSLLFSGLFVFFSWHWGLWRGGPWWKLCLWIPHCSKTVRQAREENSRNSQDANVCYSTHPFYQYSLYQPFLTGFVQYFVDCCYLYNLMVVSSFWKYLSVFTESVYCIFYCESSFRSNILVPLDSWFFDTLIPEKSKKLYVGYRPCYYFLFFHDKMFALKFTIPKKFILNKLFHVKTRFMYM